MSNTTLTGLTRDNIVGKCNQLHGINSIEKVRTYASGAIPSLLANLQIFRAVAFDVRDAAVTP